MDAHQLISDSRWAAYGHEAVEADYVYWEPKADEMNARGAALGIPDYFWRRLIGWQAGPEDRALFGPYAEPPSALHEIPVDHPVDPPPPPPVSCPCAEELAAVRADIATLRAEAKSGFAGIAAFAKRAFPWVR